VKVYHPKVHFQVEGLGIDHVTVRVETNIPPSERCIRKRRSVLIFAVGCGLAAVVYAQVGMATFVIPPVMAGVTP
jgi:hypothetical protein